jgi:hypothetical protein
MSEVSIALKLAWNSHYVKIVGKTPNNQSANYLVCKCPSLLDVCDDRGRTIAHYWKLGYNFIDLMTPERLNVVEWGGYTPLDYMLIYAQKFRIIKEFIKRGARIKLLSDNGLITSIYQYGPEIITLFAITNMIDFNLLIGGIPLIINIMSDHRGYDLMLLYHGANPHVRFHGGNIIDYFIRNLQITSMIYRILADFGVVITLPQLRKIADTVDMNAAIDGLYSFIF